MAEPRKFWDRIAERYAKKPVRDQAAYEKKLEVTREYLRPDMEALEIGCGTGTTAIHLAPGVRHIRATDISPKMIAIAQRKAGAAGIRNITFAQAALDDVSVPDAEIDVVVGFNVLHLLDDRDAAIAKIHRMLKPGGVFASSTACIGDTMKFFKVIGPIGEYAGLLPRLRVFTTEELVNSLIAAGFLIEQRWQYSRGKAVFIVARKPA